MEGGVAQLQDYPDLVGHGIMEQVRDGTDLTRHLLDYYDAGGGTYEIRYWGIAPHGTPTSDVTWVIRRLSHAVYGGTLRVVDVQTLTGSWDNRALLPWS